VEVYTSQGHDNVYVRCEREQEEISVLNHSLGDGPMVYFSDLLDLIMLLTVSTGLTIVYAQVKSSQDLRGTANRAAPE